MAKKKPSITDFLQKKTEERKVQSNKNIVQSTKKPPEEKEIAPVIEPKKVTVTEENVKNIEVVNPTIVKPNNKSESVKSKPQKNTICFSEIIDEMDEFKENFHLSSHYNVRLTDSNYDKLKYLKTTNITMVHLVNLVIKKVVDSDEFIKFIK